MITPADVKARFPEFASVEDDDIQFAIDTAVIMDGGTAYPTAINTLLLYLSAHYVQVNIETAAGNWSSMGPITSTGVGEESASYGAENAQKSPFYESLSQTKYGQRYLELLQGLKNSYFPYAVI